MGVCLVTGAGGVSWEGIAVFQSCFVSLCQGYDVVDVSCLEAPVKSSSPRGPVLAMLAPAKRKYMNFAYIFIANIRLFFGRTVGSTDVRSTHIKYWENPIFLSQHRVFFFASTFWRNSYVLNLSDISDIFISRRTYFYQILPFVLIRELFLSEDPRYIPNKTPFKTTLT